MKATKKLPKVTVRENLYGNWYGYIGGKRAEMFYNSSFESQEMMAQRWQRETEMRLSVGQDVTRFQHVSARVAANSLRSK
jgi:hypothetical protein